MGRQVKVIGLPHKAGYWKENPHQELRSDVVYLTRWAYAIFKHFKERRCAYNKVLVHSGRAAAKNKSSYDIMGLVLRTMPNSTIWFMREVEAQLREPRIGFENWMSGRGCHDEFRWTADMVWHKDTGSRLTWRGIEKKKSSLRGLEPDQNTLVVVDEAEDISEESFQLLLPTINRVPNPMMLMMCNPKDPGSPVSRRYMNKVTAGVLTVKTTWDHNPWYNRSIEAERLEAMENDPVNYDWIWNGSYAPDVGENKLLPMALIDAASQAMGSDWCPELVWERMDSPIVMGVDSAHTGKTGFCIRRGPLVKHLDSVYCGSGTRDAVLEAHRLYKLWGVEIIYFDASAATRDFGPMAEEMARREGLDWGNCIIVPVPFTAPVQGGDREFQGEELNRQAFNQLPDQLGYAVRIRMQNTHNLKMGVCKHGVKSCIVFDKALVSDQHRWQYSRIECNQVVITHTGANKIKLDKGEPSPDQFDALRISYRDDVDHGLRADSEHLAAMLV